MYRRETNAINWRKCENENVKHGCWLLFTLKLSHHKRLRYAQSGCYFTVLQWIWMSANRKWTWKRARWKKCDTVLKTHFRYAEILTFFKINFNAQAFIWKVCCEINHQANKQQCGLSQISHIKYREFIEKFEFNYMRFEWHTSDHRGKCEREREWNSFADKWIWNFILIFEYYSTIITKMYQFDTWASCGCQSILV